MGTATRPVARHSDTGTRMLANRNHLNQVVRSGATCALIIAGLASVFACSSLNTPKKSTVPQTVAPTAWVNRYEVCPSSNEYGVLVSDKVSAYDNPELSGLPVAHIPHGAQVEVLEESVGSSAWKLRHGGRTLYVDCPFVSDYDPSQGVQPNEDNCACR